MTSGQRAVRPDDNLRVREQALQVRLDHRFTDDADVRTGPADHLDHGRDGIGAARRGYLRQRAPVHRRIRAVVGDSYALRTANLI
jgi:hypothetical protein